MNPARSCILVLGMHRSGTSALTRVISLLGATLPKNLMSPRQNDNEAGFWEPRDLWALHDRMLAEAGSRWDDWRKLDLSVLPPDRLAHYQGEIGRYLADEYGDARLIVLKEPRICRFVPFYAGILRGLGFSCHPVLALRNPLGVIGSLGRRNDMPHGFAALLWLRHMLDAEIATRGTQRVIVSYDALLGDWPATVGILNTQLRVDWPGLPDDADSEIGKFLSSELRHFAPSGRELHERGDLAAWVRDAYEALLLIERDSGDMQAYRMLDRVREEFDVASSAFGAALFAEVAESASIGHTAPALAAQLVEKESVIQHLKSELGARQRVIEQLVGECAERLRVAEERRELIEQLSAALKYREAPIAQKDMVAADPQGAGPRLASTPRNQTAG